VSEDGFDEVILKYPEQEGPAGGDSTPIVSSRLAIDNCQLVKVSHPAAIYAAEGGWAILQFNSVYCREVCGH
jgi:hypothetical protein